METEYATLGVTATERLYESEMIAKLGVGSARTDWSRWSTPDDEGVPRSGFLA